MRVAAVLGRLVAALKAVVAHDGGDAQAVIGEHALAAMRLRRAVMRELAPGADRLVVAPEGKREQLARLLQALEALDRDEAVDGGEVLAQARGDVEILGRAGPRPARLRR
jgi:hypothetical protein